MTTAERADRLVTIADRLIACTDDLRRSACPLCDRTGCLSVAEEGGHIRFRCATPVPTNEDGDSVCPYELIVYATDVSEMPKPVFAEKSKAKPRRRRVS